MASHPHFDDQGTLDWSRTWDDALAAARAGNKKIIVELGRRL